MWRSPAVPPFPTTTQAPPMLLSAALMGMPPRIGLSRPLGNNSFNRNSVGMTSIGPAVLRMPAEQPWTFALPPQPDNDDTSVAEYGLLDPLQFGDAPLPRDGLLSRPGLGDVDWANEIAEPSKLDLWRRLLWRISNDADGDGPSTHEELYAEYLRLRRALADWREGQRPGLLKEGERYYYPEVRLLIEDVATATSDKEEALRRAIDQMPMLDQTTKNYFHAYLSNRINGDPEEFVRNTLLEEAEAGQIAVRTLRDEGARSFAEQFIRIPEELLEIFRKRPSDPDIDSESTLRPEVRLELKYSLAAMVKALQLYQDALSRLRQAPGDSRKRNLIQMNSLIGAAREGLKGALSRAEGRPLGPGKSFWTPTGRRFPDGSIEAADGTITNVEVKPDKRKIRSQAEKDEWAAKNLGIQTEYTHTEELIRRAKELLGEE